MRIAPPAPPVSDPHGCPALWLDYYDDLACWCADQVSQRLGSFENQTGGYTPAPLEEESDMERGRR